MCREERQIIRPCDLGWLQEGVMSALMDAINKPWLIQQEDLERILSIAQRENEITPEALQKIQAEQHRKAERMAMRDGVAIIEARGPMFKYANLFTEISGATSYEQVMRDLNVAAEDPAVNAIMLAVDSPGGHASGCDELAQAIFAMRGKKPIEAYISGVGASAAYWIASAADKITLSEASAVGSIGVIMRMPVGKEGRDHVFVSSQSPDTNTEPGRASLQKTVDALATVFISNVAKYRGVDAETVTTKFGAGGVEIGADAVRLGMADAVGQFEDALAALAKRGSRRSTKLSSGGFRMSNQQNGGETTATDIDLDKIKAEAAKSAKAEAMARVQAITGDENAKAFEKTASFLAFGTDVDAETASKILAAVAEDASKPEASKGDGKQDGDKEQQFLQSKQSSVSFSAPGGSPAAANPWTGAIENVNKRFG
jgi:capsid assembly protease